jgi:predicted small lipoprotein YifL
MEVLMRSRPILFVLSLYLVFSLIGCTSKPPADNSTADTGTTSDTNAKGAKESKEPKERGERKEAKREPLIVPSGTTITISLGSALGSKLSQSGQTFNGTVAKDVIVGNKVVIPQGSAVSGTVTDAKPLGKFKGGAELQLRLDSIKVGGSEMQVQADAQTFSAKGKGKRSAIMTGGGAALGGLIGGLAGGGKGAAIGLAAGAGAGAGGAVLTGNKDIVLPAESAVSFQLTQPLEFR